MRDTIADRDFACKLNWAISLNDRTPLHCWQGIIAASLSSIRSCTRPFCLQGWDKIQHVIEALFLGLYLQILKHHGFLALLTEITAQQLLVKIKTA